MIVPFEPFIKLIKEKFSENALDAIYEENMAEIKYAQEVPYILESPEKNLNEYNLLALPRKFLFLAHKGKLGLLNIYEIDIDLDNHLNEFSSIKWQNFHYFSKKVTGEVKIKSISNFCRYKVGEHEGPPMFLMIPNT